MVALVSQCVSENGQIETLPLLVVIVGPTGSGKSELAAQIAAQIVGEVVSCDSVAVYREMEIGAAKPSPAQRLLAPHHLLDVVAPNEQFSAGDFSRVARAAITDISARVRVPIVAGGTGLYLRALLEGLFDAPARDKNLRARLRGMAERRGPQYVHRLLQKLDAEAGARIHVNDLPKVLRALEVTLAVGVPMTSAWNAGRDPLAGYRVVKLGLNPDRKLLYQRLDRRAAEMFAAGLLRETEQLVARYGADCWPLQSLGYAQAQAVLRGEMTEAEAIAATAQGHRNYAKRQMTWFRREQDVHWMERFGEDAIEDASRLLIAPHPFDKLRAGSTDDEPVRRMGHPVE
jgi:tRNA dimethylallyltransferase